MRISDWGSDVCSSDLASRGEAQIVTDSSRARQERGDEIIDTADGALDPLTLLWDRTRPALPIYRKQPDDPDNENTLATAVFEIGADKVAWRVNDRSGQPAQFAAAERLAPLTRRAGMAERWGR